LALIDFIRRNFIAATARAVTVDIFDGCPAVPALVDDFCSGPEPLQ